MDTEYLFNRINEIGYEEKEYREKYEEIKDRYNWKEDIATEYIKYLEKQINWINYKLEMIFEMNENAEIEDSKDFKLICLLSAFCWRKGKMISPIREY